MGFSSACVQRKNENVHIFCNFRANRRVLTASETRPVSPRKRDFHRTYTPLVFLITILETITTIKRNDEKSEFLTKRVVRFVAVRVFTPFPQLDVEIEKTKIAYINRINGIKNRDTERYKNGHVN